MSRLGSTLVAVAALAAPLLPPAAAAAVTDRPSPPAFENRSASCPGIDRIAVPGAEHQVTACLADLTTASTVASGHTDPADWNGLHAPGTRNPSGVPGIQVDGYFPDTSAFNTKHGWNHDAQFVMRFPRDWNGKVVVSGAPGTRTQYAGDFVFSDWVLSRGYAYAMTDKGNSGASFHRDGETPGDAVAEWNRRVTELTLATKEVAAQVYRREPARIYLFGISNGGYLVRWQLENRPGLYDGGVDWEGTLFRTDSPNLLSHLPTALRHYPTYRATGDEDALEAMTDAGFNPRSAFTWDFHYSYYWDLTQRVYREELDPTYDGDLEAGIPFCPSGTPDCDADYDYSSRPQARAAMREVALTGDIGRPMLTLHGTLDALLPIRTDSDVYRRMVRDRGRGPLNRYHRVVGGTHVDGLHAVHGDRVRPLLPCARESFDALVRWVERGATPPPSRTVPRQRHLGELDRCEL